jgi:hypothetical protein
MDNEIFPTVLSAELALVAGRFGPRPQLDRHLIALREIADRGF